MESGIVDNTRMIRGGGKWEGRQYLERVEEEGGGKADRHRRAASQPGTFSIHKEYKV
jgi:hypothetical protein